MIENIDNVIDETERSFRDLEYAFLSLEPNTPQDFRVERVEVVNVPAYEDRNRMITKHRWYLVDDDGKKYIRDFGVKYSFDKLKQLKQLGTDEITITYELETRTTRNGPVRMMVYTISIKK